METDSDPVCCNYVEGLVFAFRGYGILCVSIVKSSEIILALKGCFFLYLLALYPSCHLWHLLTSFRLHSPVRESALLPALLPAPLSSP